MNIFLTGGTGFIGSHLINNLNTKNNHIYCQKRKKSKPRISLKKEPTWIYNVTDIELLELMKTCEVFIHSATMGVSPQKVSWTDAVRFNVQDSFNLLCAAANSGIKRFIILGSILESNDLHNENFGDKIISPYISTKEALFHLFSSFAIANDLKVVYIKIPNVFGEGQHEGNLWPSLKTAAKNGEDFIIKNKEVLKEFIPINKVVNIISKAVLFENQEYDNIDIINIRGTEKTIYEFSKYYWKKWNASGSIIFK